MHLFRQIEYNQIHPLEIRFALFLILRLLKIQVKKYIKMIYLF